MKKVGILTNLDANHGSVIFNSTLNKLIHQIQPDNQINFIDYINPRYRLMEDSRIFKINKSIPFFNMQRLINLSKYSRERLSIDPFFRLTNYESLCESLSARKYDVLIVAKVIWEISKKPYIQRFPNIFWLSENISSIKIAYAASGHLTDLEYFAQFKKKVHEILSSYALISVRDEMTQVMLEEAGVNKKTPVYRICDPSFLYRYDSEDLNSLLAHFKIKNDLPILGMLFYGKPELAEKISTHYHKKGYRIIDFSVFNPYADINLGHRVNPDEWALLFKTLDFCITDRFHGTIFCLRENIPFVSIEPFKPRTLLNSKIYSLLKDFNFVEPCYFDTYADDFCVEEFLSKCDDIESHWNEKYLKLAISRRDSQVQFHRQFLARVEDFLK